LPVDGGARCAGTPRQFLGDRPTPFDARFVSFTLRGEAGRGVVRGGATDQCGVVLAGGGGGDGMGWGRGPRWERRRGPTMGMTVRPKRVVSKADSRVPRAKSRRWETSPMVDTPHDPTYGHTMGMAVRRRRDLRPLGIGSSAAAPTHTEWGGPPPPPMGGREG